jgi:CBS-domain-containing membrane protein
LYIETLDAATGRTGDPDARGLLRHTCRATAEARDPATTTVRDVMSQDVAFCFDDQRASEAVRIMRERKVRRLPVFDHDKHMVGILTLSDLSIHTPEATGEVVRSLSTRH